MMNSLRSRGSVKMRALAVTPLLALAVTGGAISHANASDGGSAKPTTVSRSAATPADPGAEYGPCTLAADSPAQVTSSDGSAAGTPALCKK